VEPGKRGLKFSGSKKKKRKLWMNRSNLKLQLPLRIKSKKNFRKSLGWLLAFKRMTKESLLSTRKR